MAAVRRRSFTPSPSRPIWPSTPRTSISWPPARRSCARRADDLLLNQPTEAAGASYPMQRPGPRVPPQRDLSSFNRSERVPRVTPGGENAEELRLIANAVPALLSYVDLEGRYVWCNESYQRAFSYTSEQI